MADIQQPNIVGNFLQNYYGAQDRVQAQQDAQLQQQRQAVADQRSATQFDQQNQQFNWTKDQHEVAAKADAVANAIMNIRPGDAVSFNTAKQNLLAQGVITPQEASQYDISHLQDLQMQSEKWRQVKAFQLQQQTGQSELSTAQAQRGLIGAQTREANAKAKAMGAQSGGTYGSGSAAPEIAPGVFVPDPYANIQDPKQRDQFYRQNAKEFDARQKTYNEDRVAANNIINLTKEFTAIGDKVGSGGMTGTGGVSSMWGVSALRRGLDSNWQRLSAIQDRLTPLMRQGMPGAASDRDVAMFRGASVSTDNYGPANKAIAQGLQNAAKNAIDQGLFNEWYFQKFKHLQGSDNAWNQYLQDNPIFDPSSDLADAKLNKNRMTWKQYFSGQRAASAGSAPAPAAAPAPVAPTQQSGAVPPPPPGYVVR